MRLSELQNKEVVNILDGRNIGNIIDAKVDLQSGEIVSLIVETKGKIISFSRNEESEVKWQNIERIGEDVILVRYGS